MLRHQLSPEKWSTTQQVPKFSPPTPVTTFIFLLFHSNPYQNYLPPSFHFIRCTLQVPLKYRHAWVCFNLILGPLINNICKSILQHSSCQTKMLMCVFVWFGCFFFFNSKRFPKGKVKKPKKVILSGEIQWGSQGFRTRNTSNFSFNWAWCHRPVTSTS